MSQGLFYIMIVIFLGLIVTMGVIMFAQGQFDRMDDMAALEESAD